MPSFRVPKSTIIIVVALVGLAALLSVLPALTGMGGSLRVLSLYGAMAVAGLSLIAGSIGLMRGRAKVLNIGPEFVEGYNSSPVVEIPELGSDEYQPANATTTPSPDDDFYDDDETKIVVKKAKLTAAEKRALREAKRAEKLRKKQEAKFRKKAEKDARLAARLAAKAQLHDTVLDDESLYAAVEEDDINVDSTGRHLEIDKNPDWLHDAYHDPNFAIPFADQQEAETEVLEAPVVVDNTKELIAAAAAALLQELRNVEIEAAAERLALRNQMSSLTEHMNDLTVRLAELNLDTNKARAAAAFVSLEHLATTHTRYLDRIARLKDMLMARGNLDDVSAALIDLLLNETAADEAIIETVAQDSHPLKVEEIAERVAAHLEAIAPKSVIELTPDEDDDLPVVIEKKAPAKKRKTRTSRKAKKETELTTETVAEVVAEPVSPDSHTEAK